MSCKGGGHGEGAKHSFLATGFVNCWPVLSTLWQERLTTHLVPCVFGRGPELTRALGQWVKASPRMMVKPEEMAPFPFYHISLDPTWTAPNPYRYHSRPQDGTPHLFCPPLHPQIFQNPGRMPITCCLVTQGPCGRGCPREGRSQAGCFLVFPFERGGLWPGFGPEPPPGLPTSWAGTGLARSGFW